MVIGQGYKQNISAIKLLLTSISFISMNNEIDAFYLIKDEPGKGCLLALRTSILAQDTNINETIKYEMPCFCYHKKPICYLWLNKKTNDPYILVVHGKQINHPKLEEGKRAKMKILRIISNEDLPIVAIKEIINMAIIQCQ